MFRNRKVIIQYFFVVASFVLLLKAVQLQVLNTTFQERAKATTINKFALYPSRGLIYDRNDKLLINNNPIYDLMVIYNQISPDMDTTKFFKLLGIGGNYYKEALDKDWTDKRYSPSVPFVFLSKISAKTFASFQESMYEFPGFSIQLRNVRAYPHTNAAHLLGHISEVNKDEVNDSLGTYILGDYIGASGLESEYEEILRGQKGFKFVLKDNMGREVGPYENELMDIKPVSGKDLIISIDLELQAYGEALMEGKIGSIVAIDPATGEILAMVSTPSYDPNLLTISQKRGESYYKLEGDPNKPFLNRSVQGWYPPGSLFKPLVALIAMQEEVLNPNRTINCASGYYYEGKLLMACHNHPNCNSIEMALQHSCNAYFVTIFRDIVDKYGFYNPQTGLDSFNTYLSKFGLGRKLGIDLPVEKAGYYPNSSYFDDYFDKQQKGQRWNSIWIRSLAIGQGELLMTNLQMANVAAILANRGYYYMPHLIKAYKDGTPIPEKFTIKNYVGIDSIHFQRVVNGMEKAVAAGTARLAYIPGIALCGKTGTAENPHGKDHSIFFSFAPKDKPQIAIAVYVENGGWGGSYAAPIASLMTEKYINGKINPYRVYLEKRMKESRLIDTP